MIWIRYKIEDEIRYILFSGHSYGKIESPCYDTYLHLINRPRSWIGNPYSLLYGCNETLLFVRTREFEDYDDLDEYEHLLVYGD